MDYISTVYGSYLYFQLYSHAKLYDDSGDDIIKSVEYSPRSKGKNPFKHHHDDASDRHVPHTTTTNATNSRATENTSSATDLESQAVEEQEEEERPQMSVWMTIILLIAITVVRWHS